MEYEIISKYDMKTSCHFRKSKDPFGEFSNMTIGFPVEINGATFSTTESLFQATRFPDNQEYQKEILKQRSPMAAKMISKKYKKDTRSGWYEHRIEIMNWCLRIKLAQNFKKFGDLLRSTGSKPLVELSYRDDYWGAKPQENGTLSGYNVLGKLLMNLREDLINNDPETMKKVMPPEIENFKILGSIVQTIDMN